MGLQRVSGAFRLGQRRHRRANDQCLYLIHHDKVIVADRQAGNLESFNYSDAAARKNSENVLVTWNNPKLADIYRNRWRSRARAGMDYACGLIQRRSNGRRTNRY
jgi:phosphatidylserine/phosphatidylglycerophosphate/cardiolipin synthase-like enzyme